jgi:hypothetical protein
VIEENASLKLLPSQKVHGQISISEHNSINNVPVTMFNKDKHTAKVNLYKSTSP